MTKLRKITGILPLMVAGLLFSIVVSVFARVNVEDRHMPMMIPVDGGGGGGGYPGTLFEGYIGKIESDLTGDVEIIKLYLYRDAALTEPLQTMLIYSGGSWGKPIGLITAAISAQAQRTFVSIYADDIGGDTWKVSVIKQEQLPDDIAGMFDGKRLSEVNSKINEIESKTVSQSSLLNDIAYNQVVNVINTINPIADKINGYQPRFTTLTYQVGDVKNKVNSLNTGLSSQGTTIDGLSSTLGTVKGRTNTLYNETVPYANTTISGDVAYLATESTWINNAISSQNALIENIYNVTLNVTQ